MHRPETKRREACAGRRASGRRGAGDSAGGGAVGLEGHERLCSSHAHISPDGGGLQAGGDADRGDWSTLRCLYQVRAGRCANVATRGDAESGVGPSLPRHAAPASAARVLQGVGSPSA